jgi:hypothetical protein
MKLLRMAIAPLLVAVLGGVAYVGQATESAAAKMTTAAQKFLDTLSAEQKAKAVIAFDDKERTNWHFTPREDKATKQPTRKGLSLEAMTAEQKAAARDLIRAGTSERGYTAATTIMSLEAILKELEQGKGPTRNPEWYFFAVFGTPSKTGKWGWRVEGHHLALNFTFDSGKVVSSTPAFFGANPATVKDGPRKGLRTLPAAEDLARELFRSLSPEQQQVAHQEKQFPEIQEGKDLPDVGAPRGLAYAKMDAKQRELLMKLVEDYASRMPAEIAAVQLAEVKEAGVDKVHFAYAGGAEAGQPHTYRVQGPTFVIEFLNVQADSAKNPANHIHSAWRSLKNDFGLAAR